MDHGFVGCWYLVGSENVDVRPRIFQCLLTGDLASSRPSRFNGARRKSADDLFYIVDFFFVSYVVLGFISP